MDPVTAIGLASAILTFVEFSWGLVQGAGDIYRSPTGSTQENASIGTIIADLEEVAGNINTDIRGHGKHEEALVSLAKGCGDLSKELLQLLEKLKTKSHSKREVLKATLRSMRKEREIASIEKRLGEYRSGIVVRLNMVLYNQQSAIKEQLDAIQHDSRKLAGESSKGIEDLRSMLSNIMDQLRYEHNDNLIDPSSRDTEISQLGQTLSELLLALNSKIVALPKEMAVLRRLSFDAMFRREDGISGPGHGTFEWILDGIDIENTEHSNWSNDFSDNERTNYENIPESPSNQSVQEDADSSTRNSEGGLYGFHYKWKQLYNERDENHVIFGQTAGKQFVTYATFDFDRYFHDNETHGLGCSDPDRQDLKDSTETQGSYYSDDSSISDWSDSIQSRQQGIERTQPLDATHSSTKDALTLKLHGVYYRSGPSISKIHGNEPLSQYSQYNGWAPHLDHIMSVSERAKRRLISTEFSSFLRDSQGVYFCCGKAGSGKSTFMKFIAGHRDVLKQLEFWSGRKKLVVISMFFWNSGDELQMSIEGFYRSLLFQVVQQCPEILPEIFPEHQMRGAELEEGVRGTLLPFRFSELQEAIRRLLKTSEFPNHRLCFFIDGLDEFKGESREHVAFAQLLKHWATKDVKIVCSARPHFEFLDTFTDPYRTVQLHEWTKDDIYRHVSSELHSGLGSDRMSTGSLARLADMVSRRADGVFIWARLVLESLLDGIAHRDSMKALQERVDQAPRDLNLLYERILDSIDSTVRRRAEDALFIVARSPYGMLNALAFSWLDDLEDEDFPFNRPFHIYTTEEVDDRIETAKHQVVLLTKGLVEMRNSQDFKTGFYEHRFFEHALGYHHLTTHDFLMARAVASEDRHSAEGLRDRLARLTLAEIKFSGYLKWLSPRFRTIYSAGVHTFHEIPDRFLNELGACYPIACASDGARQKAPHLGLYDSQSQGRVHIILWGQRDLWRSPRSIRYLVWKGSDASLFICYALSLHQAGFVVRRLQNGDVARLSEEELAVWLLATWTIFPDPAITECILSFRGLPKRPVEVCSHGVGETLEVSCWFGFLISFCRLVQIHAMDAFAEQNLPWGSPLWEGSFPWNEPWDRIEQRTWIEMQCQNLEHLLRHGADQNVVFLLGHTAVNHAPQVTERGNEWDEWVLDPGPIFYTDLLTMVQLIQPPPPNLKQLHELLGAFTVGRLRNATGRFLSQTWSRFSGGARKSASKKMHKAAKLEDIEEGKYVVYGIQSTDELLMGPLNIMIY